MLDYNTSRSQLVLPEYGRTIQSMVDHAQTIEDRDERTRCVNTIAQTIYTLFPSLKEDENYKQKVWTHIAMMADYKLDVDSPYPLPERPEASQPSAEHIPYPNRRIRNRQYGSIVEETIAAVRKSDNDEERAQVVAMVALYMRNQILLNGKDSNAEDKVMADIEELSEGEFQYDFSDLRGVIPQNTNLVSRARNRRNRDKKNKQNQQNQQNRRKRKY